MTKHVAIEKKHSNRSTSHKKTTHHNAHPNGVMPKNIMVGGRYLQKKLMNNVATHITLGLIAMGVAGASTLFLLNSKRKRENSRRFYKAYSGVRDDAKDLAHNAYERGRKAYETASDYAENIRDTAYDIIEQPYSKSLLLAGTVGGTILGASLIYFLNKDKKLDKGFLSKTIDVIDSLKEAATSVTDDVKSTDWGGLATDFLETISEKLHGEEPEERNSFHNNHSQHRVVNNLQTAIDMGVTGFRLWQKLKNKRK